jgi:sugar lactone lactonase YvrE
MARTRAAAQRSRARCPLVAKEDILTNTHWTKVSESPHELGEGLRLIDGVPHWVDILRGELRCAPDGRLLHAFDRPLGFVDRLPDGRLIAALGTGISEITADGALSVGDTGLEDARYRVNDGGVAPDGSVWFGTMAHNAAEGEGCLWRWDAETHEVTPLRRDMWIPNGPSFFGGCQEVLLADSAIGRIYRAEIPAGLGPLVWQDFASVEGGNPDGMHIDAASRVWNPVWGASRIDVYTRTGQILGVIALPVTQATSALTTDDGRLFVTSATVGLADPGPLDGHTIVADLAAVWKDPSLKSETTGPVSDLTFKGRLAAEGGSLFQGVSRTVPSSINQS